MAESQEPPTLRIVTPDVSAEEVAALVAVFAAAGAAAEAAATTPRPRSAWRDPARGVRGPLHPGPGAWRASALPR